MTYTVTLVDFPDMRSARTHAAEARFRAALDEALGDRLLTALNAFQSATELNEDELTRDEIDLASDWAIAYAKADEAGFWGLGSPEDAYFEVRAA